MAPNLRELASDVAFRDGRDHPINGLNSGITCFPKNLNNYMWCFAWDKYADVLTLPDEKNQEARFYRVSLKRLESGELDFLTEEPSARGEKALHVLSAYKVLMYNKKID
ncbi:MAG: hypothetical protein AABX23_04680 [Nanoarchaeota archaeon]|mgnify:CR=1 FL=1